MSASAIRVEGLDEVLGNLNRAVNRLPKATKAGMIKGALRIQKGSQELVPIDLGNLRSSAFVIWGNGGSVTASFTGPDAADMNARHMESVASENASLNTGILKPQVEVGYSAFYAIFVHEDLSANHNKTFKTKGKLNPLTGGSTSFESRTVGEAKFLEKSVKNNKDQVLNDIKSMAKI